MSPRKRYLLKRFSRFLASTSSRRVCRSAAGGWVPSDQPRGSVSPQERANVKGHPANAGRFIAVARRKRRCFPWEISAFFPLSSHSGLGPHRSRTSALCCLQCICLFRINILKYTPTQQGDAAGGATLHSFHLKALILLTVRLSTLLDGVFPELAHPHY